MKNVIDLTRSRLVLAWVAGLVFGTPWPCSAAGAEESGGNKIVPYKELSWLAAPGSATAGPPIKGLNATVVTLPAGGLYQSEEIGALNGQRATLTLAVALEMPPTVGSDVVVTVTGAALHFTVEKVTATEIHTRLLVSPGGAVAPGDLTRTRIVMTSRRTGGGTIPLGVTLVFDRKASVWSAYFRELLLAENVPLDAGSKNKDTSVYVSVPLETNVHFAGIKTGLSQADVGEKFSSEAKGLSRITASTNDLVFPPMHSILGSPR